MEEITKKIQKMLKNRKTTIVVTKMGTYRPSSEASDSVNFDFESEDHSK